MINNYNYTVTYSLSDTFSHTRYQNMIIQDKFGLGVNDGLLIPATTESWNCNRQANDMEYINLVSNADTLYFHFQFPDYVNDNPQAPTVGWFTGGAYLIKAELYDFSDSLNASPMTDWGAYFAGWGSKGFSFQNLTVNIDDIPLSCFYFKFSVMGQDSEVFEFFTEPFKKITCEKTVLIESTYRAKDNFGYYHGAPTAYLGNSDDPFTIKFRIEAELLQESGDIQRKEIKNEFGRSMVVSTNTLELWKLRCRPMPPYMANRLINAFAGETIKVEGIEFIRAKNVNKNNDVSRMWIPEIDLEKEKDQIRFECQ